MIAFEKDHPDYRIDQKETRVCVFAREKEIRDHRH